jgi:hypothetical protein
MSKNFMNALFRRSKLDRKCRDGNDHDDILLWARRHIAAEFPNPTRKDCPGSELLSNLINRGQFPDTDVKRHLLSCSNCFSEYRTALAGHQGNSATVDLNLSKPVFGVRLALVLALLLLLVSGVGVILWSRRESPDRYVIQVPPAQSPSTIATRSIESKPTPETETDRSPRNNVVVAVNTVNVDLAAFQQTRDASGKNQQAIRLTHGVNELAIKLPRRSPPGTYRITLADSFGKQVLTSSAKLHAGRIVRSRLNLPSLNEGTYTFCVSSNGEAPDCLPAKIGNR